MAIAAVTVVLSSLFLVYWFKPGRVVCTRQGTVIAAHQLSNSKHETSWNVLVYIYQQNELGYLVNTGYVALNGIGTNGHGNYCWSDGNGSCLSSPLNFRLNQTLSVAALNNGQFMKMNRQT